jgi:hypothetical protein
MTNSDLMPFIAHLVKVAALFKDRLTEDVQELYFDALADLPFEDVVAGLAITVRTCTFMPKPVEIRRALAAPTGDLELTIEAAWLHYRQLAHHVGGYQSVTIEDQALAEALLALFGSWEEACWTDFSPEMWASKRKEFGRVYRVMLERGERGAMTLEGYCGRDNRERGYLVPPNAAGALEGPSTRLKLLPPAVTTNVRGLLDPHEAQRDIWRANLREAIARHYAATNGEASS